MKPQQPDLSSNHSLRWNWVELSNRGQAVDSDNGGNGIRTADRMNKRQRELSVPVPPGFFSRHLLLAFFARSADGAGTEISLLS